MPIHCVAAAVAGLLLSADLTSGAHNEIASGTLIVLNKSDATAWLISAATGQRLASVPTGAGPHEVAVSPDGRLAVVTNYGQREPGSSLTVIDVPRAAVLRTIDLGEYRRPHGAAFFRDGHRVAVTAEHNRALLIVDVAAGRVLKAIPTDQEISHMVALSPDERLAFVANIRSGTVTVIDISAGRAEAHIATGGGTEGLDISPDGRWLWVGNRAEDTISIIDVAAKQVAATVPCASFPIRVKFTPDGRHVLVSNARSGDVAIFDADQRTEVARIPIEMTPVQQKDERLFQAAFGDSPVPIGILIEPTGRRAWVAATNADALAVIDLHRKALVGSVRTGREPDGLGWSPATPAAR